MPRDPAPTRRRILDAAYALFYRHGFARVGVDAVAAKAAVTKRTLYDHFRSKDDLLAAVLALQHDLALERVQQWRGRPYRGPDDLVDALFTDLVSWSATPRWSGSGFSRLVMELADLPGHPARVMARRHKAAIESWLAEEMQRANVTDPGDAARAVMLLIEGAMSLILIHGDARYAAAAARMAKQIVSAAARPNRRGRRHRAGRREPFATTARVRNG